MLHYLKTKDKLPKFEPRDAAILIKPSDFPGREAVARVLISEMEQSYAETARIASMTFCRGSVLMQEARGVTEDMIDRALRK